MVLSFCVCAADRATTVTAWRFLLTPGRHTIITLGGLCYIYADASSFHN